MTKQLNSALTSLFAFSLICGLSFSQPVKADARKSEETKSLPAAKPPEKAETATANKVTSEKPAAGTKAEPVAKNTETKGNPQVILTTSEGEIVLELFKDKAPKTVENFLKYVDKKFYDGTIFHRVIPQFMIQGGGMTADMSEKSTNPPVENEAGNGLKNEPGTVAMARTNEPNSATAQFFINVADNASLNHRSNQPRDFGYAVFGKVISGMEVVRKIEKTATTTKYPHENVPVNAITIKSAKRK